MPFVMFSMRGIDLATTGERMLISFPDHVYFERKMLL